MADKHSALDTFMQLDNFIKVAVWDEPETKGIEVSTLCCLHGVRGMRVAILSNVLQMLEITAEELLDAYQMCRKDESKNNES